MKSIMVMKKNMRMTITMKMSSFDQTFLQKILLVKGIKN